MAEITYGYVRVSTQEQNETRQLAAMRGFGVEGKNIVVEKMSGKDFRRPRYRKLVKALQPGDVLVVKSIDRLGRNYDEILEQWGVITKKRKAAIVVLDILNRSFMIDWQDRLYMDSVLVRFEDGKLNPKATFTALAAFLDLPYTESMTYCSLKGEIDPESLEGNDLGFSTAAIYRTYDDYANDAERYCLEYFLRDAYEYYGYEFQYYDQAPVDEERLRDLAGRFTAIDHYIGESWRRNVFSTVEIRRDGQDISAGQRELTIEEMVKNQLREIRENRLRTAMFLLNNRYFINKDGQPLHMMPKLELDPELLEQPLYH